MVRTIEIPTDLVQVGSKIQQSWPSACEPPLGLRIGRRRTGRRDAIVSPKGCPFGLGLLQHGERVVDIGAGAGIDSLIAARMAGPGGHVIGVDMTAAMLDKARRVGAETGLHNVEFRLGTGERLPVEDGWADVIMSNGVLNLMPDKSASLAEMASVLRPRGRLQIADILVQKPVPESAKQNIDLWTGWIAGALLE